MAETTPGTTAADQGMLNLASTIIAAYVSNNPVPVTDLTSMIKSVHGALCGLAGAASAEAAPGQKPAVTMKKSITTDYLVCLEDGRKLKMLKRYLRTKYNLSPEQYRSKWGLPRDYPMVAGSYSVRRSEFAKKFGLGRTKSKAPAKRRKRA